MENSNNQYFLLYGTEDGIFLKKIDNIESFLKEACEEEYQFLDDFPETRWDKTRTKLDNTSFDCDEREYILIHGKIVVPKKKEVITKYEVD